VTAEGSVMGDVCEYTEFSESFSLKVSEKHRKLKLEIQCEDVHDFTVADLRNLDIDIQPLKELGGYESGYLILKDGSSIRYHEVNQLVRMMLCKMLS
jgi:hypothetical protein